MSTNVAKTPAMHQLLAVPHPRYWREWELALLQLHYPHVPTEPIAAALGRPVAVTKTAIEGWSEDWHGCIYIGLPTGQVSWHFHDSQAHLFDGLPQQHEAWDGHDTPEKYRRVDAAFRA